MIDPKLVQAILRRLESFSAHGAKAVGSERLEELAEKSEVLNHLLFLKSKGLIECKEIRATANGNLKRLALIRLTPAGYKAALAGSITNNPWVSGSFYLVSVVVIGAFLLIAANLSPWYVLPVVILGWILAVCVIGAFQLLNDERLSEKPFVELMWMTLKQLPFIRNKEGR